MESHLIVMLPIAICNTPTAPLQNALATTLRNAFSYTINHRLPKDQLPLSKKWGALLVVRAAASAARA